MGREAIPISQITNLPSNRVNTFWLDPPATGNYQLFIEAVAENNSLIESEKINININIQ